MRYATSEDFAKPQGLPVRLLRRSTLAKPEGALLWAVMFRKRRGSELPRSLFTMEIHGEPFGLYALITSSGSLAR